MWTDIGYLVTELGKALTAEPASFRFAATHGERLRRVLTLAEDAAPDANKALDQYQSYLQSLDTQDSDEFVAGLSEAIDKLAQYASVRSNRRNSNDGKALLAEIDDLLSCLVACTRAGALPERDLQKQAELVHARVKELAPRLSELWQFAEDVELSLGPDPDFRVSEWWETLATFASSRQELAAAVSSASPAHKAALIDEAVKRLTRPSLAERVLEGLKSFTRLEFALQPALVEQFATPAPTSKTVLFESDDLTIFVRGDQLGIWVAPGHDLEGLSATYSSGEDTPFASDVEGRLGLTLPENMEDKALNLVLRIDGVEVALPPLVLKRA